MELLTVNRFNQAAQPLLRSPPEHYAQARGNKIQVICLMPPMEFLKLASPPDQINDFLTATQGVKAYNSYTKAGEIIHMPFLRITVPDLAQGHVTAHEGRHRAAAVINAGGKWLRVGLDLDADAGYEPEISKQEVAQHGHPRNNVEYCMTAADMPALIQCQYAPVVVSSRGWKIEEPDNLGRYRR